MCVCSSNYCRVMVYVQLTKNKVVVVVSIFIIMRESVNSFWTMIEICRTEGNKLTML